MVVASLTDKEKEALEIIAQREAQATTTKYEKAVEHFEAKVDAPERTKATKARERRRQQITSGIEARGLPTIYKGETIPLRDLPYTRVYPQRRATPTIGGYTLTSYADLPQVRGVQALQALGWERVPSPPSQYFAEFMELNRPMHPSELTGEDVPFYEAVNRYLRETMVTIPSSPLLPSFGLAGDFARGVFVGAIKEVESTVGFIEAIFGQPSRRSYIPTVGSALVSEGIGIFTGRPLGESFGEYTFSLGEEPTGEAFGELLSIYGMSTALTAIGGRIFSYLGGTRVGQAVKFSSTAKALSTTTTKLKQVLPAWRGSRVDVWFTKHSKYYYKKTGGISVGEVVLPYTRGVRYPMAQYGASLMMEAPRTSGVGIGKFFVEPTSKGMKHLISRGGMLSVGYLRDLGFKKTPIEILAEQRAVLPLVTQTHVTRMGIFPYVGGKKAHTTLSKTFMLPLIGIPKIKGKTKTWTSTTSTIVRELQHLKTGITLKEEEKEGLAILPKLDILPEQVSTPVQTLDLILKPALRVTRVKRKRRQVSFLRQIHAPKIVPLVKQVEKQEQMITPIQIQEQKLIQNLKIPPPFLEFKPPSMIPPALMDRRGGFDRSRPGRLFFGRWGLRTHPIKTYKEMERSFFGIRRSPKRKRKNRKRKLSRRLGVSWF